MEEEVKSRLAKLKTELLMLFALPKQLFLRESFPEEVVHYFMPQKASKVC